MPDPPPAFPMPNHDLAAQMSGLNINTHSYNSTPPRPTGTGPFSSPYAGTNYVPSRNDKPLPELPSQTHSVSESSLPSFRTESAYAVAASGRIPQPPPPRPAIANPLPRPPALLPLPNPYGDSSFLSSSAPSYHHIHSAPNISTTYSRPQLNPPSQSTQPSTSYLTLFPTPQPASPTTASSAPLLPIPGKPRPSSLPATPSPSTQSTPASTSDANGSATQCQGLTKSGKQCTRQVKAPPTVSSFLDSDETVERFCFQHTKELLNPSGFYSRKQRNEWINFEDWIPDYLQADTKVALRVEMEKSASPHDVPGYIYAYEIRNPKTPNHVHLKVGRAVNLVKRIDEWSKQCGSKEVVLRGWWPGTIEPDGSLLKGRVKAGEKGPYCHRLERLIHIELADLSTHAPYLDPHFQKTKGKKAKSKDDLETPPKPRKGAAAAKMSGKPCPDCGKVHKEIFTFSRPNEGRLKGREWESLVQPVIEKWGAFVEAYV